MRQLVSAFRGPKHTIDQQDLFPLADDQFGLKNPSRRVILLWYYNSRLTNCYIKLLLVNLLMINYPSVGHEYQFAGDNYVASRFSSLMSQGWRLRQWPRKYSHQLPLSWVYAIPSSDSTGCYLLRVAKSIQWVLDLILNPAVCTGVHPSSYICGTTMQPYKVIELPNLCSRKTSSRVKPRHFQLILLSSLSVPSLQDK